MSTILKAAPTPSVPPPLSTGLMLLLHLLPRIVAALGYFLLMPVFRQSNLPAGWAISLTALVLVAPLELGYLLWLGRRERGRLTLEGVVLNRERTPLAQYLWLVPLLLAWFLFVTFGIGVWMSNVLPGLFHVWPPGLAASAERLPTPAQLAVHSRSILLGVTAILMTLQVFVGSLVSEYYYRGYLLPRISNLGPWAPLVSAVLSALSFPSAPWQMLLPVLGMLPAVYAVWWKRDIRIAIGTRWIYGVLTALPMLLNYRFI